MWITNHKDQRQVSIEIGWKLMYLEVLVVLANGTIIIGSFFLLKMLVNHQLYLDDSCRAIDINID